MKKREREREDMERKIDEGRDRQRKKRLPRVVNSADFFARTRELSKSGPRAKRDAAAP